MLQKHQVSTGWCGCVLHSPVLESNISEKAGEGQGNKDALYSQKNLPGDLSYCWAWLLRAALS